MTLTIPLSPDTESKLRDRAAAEGKDPSVVAAQLLEAAINRPALDELLAPLRRQFAATGNTDEQLVEQITQARDAYRKQR
ncbi:MAG TPA: hypothetical protein VIM11_08170 [Tepidisphaeraceae bacterium]|jgi:predicted transcriptional regulator